MLADCLQLTRAQDLGDVSKLSRNQAGQHKPNVIINVTFLYIVISSLMRYGMGRTSTMTSVAMFNAPAMIQSSVEGPQWPWVRIN